MVSGAGSQLSVAQCLRRAPELAQVSDTARLDLELLLCQILERNRTWLYTWPEHILSESQQLEFERLLARRLVGEPLAHLTGRREFWSLSLQVDASTLIPRPDTESLVEATLECFAADSADQPRALLDLGTGTGAVALALASEKPQWRLIGLDLSPAAVELAERNRAELGFNNVEFLQSDWFSALSASDRFDAIVSNPPYIDPEDPHLGQGDLRFEPQSALVAEAEGLADLAWIIERASSFLRPGGWLLLEHGWEQAPEVRRLLNQAYYKDVETLRDLGGRERISCGRLVGQTS